MSPYEGWERKEECGMGLMMKWKMNKKKRREKMMMGGR